MFYVYLLESVSAQGERYLGMTTDLKERVLEHNVGKSSHTSKFKPWKLITYIAFTDRAKAEAFVRNFKSGSGHAFARKRLGNLVFLISASLRFQPHDFVGTWICGRMFSICDRPDSIQGGRHKCVPRSSSFSSNVKPGGSVAISNSTPPGSRK